jgi:dihydrofolate reductase
MRKVILDLAVSLDGLIEGPNGEYDWCIMDEEVKFDAFLNQIDIIFFGRKSYELWGNYIPGPDTPQLEKELWELTNSKQKYVFSRTLKSASGETKLISDNILEEVQKIKQQNGKDIWLYGGASLVTTFINLKLIDEYRLAVHPIILGKGKPLFQEIPGRVKLKLSETRVHSSGVILLTYKPG